MRTNSVGIVDHGLYLREAILFALIIPHTGQLFKGGGGFHSGDGLIFEDLRYIYGVPRALI